jgi:hypothetical protein
MALAPWRSRMPPDQDNPASANDQTFVGETAEHSPGGARVGHASLMRPERPLPTLPFAVMPLRRSPNDAAAIVAA